MEVLCALFMAIRSHCALDLTMYVHETCSFGFSEKKSSRTKIYDMAVGHREHLLQAQRRLH